jgi:hypothetical protein
MPVDIGVIVGFDRYILLAEATSILMRWLFYLIAGRPLVASLLLVVSDF